MIKELDRRASGVLLHLSSLPGPHGVGDLGPAALDFLDYLCDAKQHWWQMLPVGPIGAGNSPYQSASSFAGNPLFVSLERLRDDGLLESADLRKAPKFSATRAQYDLGEKFKLSMLRRAFLAFGGGDASYERFVKINKYWLDNYANFRAFEGEHRGRPLDDWPPPDQRRESEDNSELRFHKFVQYQFAKQWETLRSQARRRNIRLMGDVPIFVSYESADVWANPALFQLDRRLRPTHVAGVPPDYFCATGQLWGNPLYRWAEHARSDYAWWIARLRAQLDRFDLIRLDHFRGFEAYWRVPAGAPTAEAGRWTPGPRDAFFNAIERALGSLPFIAEDLGDITPPVLALRDRFGLPGMKVLHFAFGSGPENSYLPSHYQPHCVVYTGTHDNDTTRGWVHSLPARSAERVFLQKYLGVKAQVHRELARLALGSVARLCILPMQDVLGLGSTARMNVPGDAMGNWRWRVTRAQLDDESPRRWLAESTQTYGRFDARAHTSNDGAGGSKRNQK